MVGGQVAVGVVGQRRLARAAIDACELILGIVRACLGDGRAATLPPLRRRPSRPGESHRSNYLFRVFGSLLSLRFPLRDTFAGIRVITAAGYADVTVD